MSWTGRCCSWPVTRPAMSPGRPSWWTAAGPAASSVIEGGRGRERAKPIQPGAGPVRQARTALARRTPAPGSAHCPGLPDTVGQPGDAWESYYAQRILGHFSRSGSWARQEPPHGCRRVAAILDRVSDDVDWAAEAASKTAPWCGPRAGRDGVASFFSDLASSIEIGAFTPHSCRRWPGRRAPARRLGHPVGQDGPRGVDDPPGWRPRPSRPSPGRRNGTWRQRRSCVPTRRERARTPSSALARQGSPRRSHRRTPTPWARRAGRRRSVRRRSGKLRAQSGRCRAVRGCTPSGELSWLHGVGFVDAHAVDDRHAADESLGFVEAVGVEDAIADQGRG